LTDIVKLLLQNETVDPTCKNNGQLLLATKRGYLEIVELLLRDSRINPSEPQNEGLKCAITTKNVALINLYLSNKIVVKSLSNRYSFKDVLNCAKNDIELIKLLLNVNPNISNLYLNRVNNSQTVLDVMLEDKTINISSYYKYAFADCVRSSCLVFVKLLLKDDRMDKIERDKIAIKSLVSFANDIIFCEMLKLFLNFDVDITSCSASSLRWACMKYRYILIEKILNHNDFDPSVQNNYLIRKLSEQGAADLVAKLLKDTRINPSACDNYAIIEAVKNQHYSVVELLLRDSRVDPSARDNYAIIEAVKHQHYSVVELLLRDSRVNPSARDNFILGYSISFETNECKHIAVLLLTNERVLKSLCRGMLKVSKEWYINHLDWLKTHKSYDKLTQMLRLSSA
jgi:hypothetical protein